MKNSALPLLLTLLFTTGLCAQVVNIPDLNFRAALQSNPAINTNGDGEIQVVEAEAYEGGIYVAGLDIYSLAGIEAFTGIDTLDCSSNHLTGLDLRSNSALAYLDCQSNNLTSLDLSGNPALNWLLCHSNQLASLDLSANPALLYLQCRSNLLASLDVSANPNLVYLRCNDNQLVSLGLSANPALKRLFCYDNQLTELTLAEDSALREIECFDNQLPYLDVSAAPDLEALICNDNHLEFLDLSANSELVNLECQDNQLVLLNIQNGNNLNFSHFNALNNPELSCIQVDDPDWATEHWGGAIDESNVFRSYCTGPVVNIPDAIFKSALINNPAINTNGDAHIQEHEAKLYTGSIEAPALGISSLEGLEAFIAIDSLDCSGNGLERLNISSNPALVHLNCSGNSIINLNLNANPELVKLDCSNNQLRSIYLAGNPALEFLDCRNNQLEYLNIQNGHNANMPDFDARGNLGLSCIQVDDPAEAAANWGSYVDPTAAFGVSCPDDTVYIPDASFKGALLNNPDINLNGDVEIQVFEARPYNGSIYVSDRNIHDLTGLEAFTSIIALDCSKNYLLSLDVSANPALTYLNCRKTRLWNLRATNNPALETINCRENNRLNILDVSGCQRLKYLDCARNDLLSLDVSSSPGLEYLDCYDNDLTSLNVSANPALEYLDCSRNESVSLDLSDHPALVTLKCNRTIIQEHELDASAHPNLQYLDCYESFISHLNVSGAPALSYLNCSRNSLTSLDASGALALNYLNCSQNSLNSLDVSANPDLEDLRCYRTNLAGLDASRNANLKTLLCYDSRLTSLNIQNGNNLNMASFDARENSGLACIQVDDPGWASVHWPGYVDPTASFGEGYGDSCIAVSLVYIPDANFKAALLSNPAINTNADEEIQTSEAEAYNGAIEVAWLNIADLAGIEAFTAIDTLNCSNNQLTRLDISNNQNLSSLDCSNNQISSLLTNDNQRLAYLNCSGNQLPTLNLSYNPALRGLNCADNQLTNLPLNTNRDLMYLDCRNNSLEYLDARNGNNSNFVYFNAAGNPALDCIQVDDPAWAAANWAGGVDTAAMFNSYCEPVVVYIPDLRFKSALVNNSSINTNGDAEIQVFEAEAYPGAIDVSESNISDLTGLEAFINICTLKCQVNNLTSLDVSANEALVLLYCWSNQITGLNLGRKPALRHLACYHNQITNLDLSLCPALEGMACYDNPLGTLDVSSNPALRNLTCYDNQLTSLNLSGNPALRLLQCQKNKLRGLDLSNNPAFARLFCYNNNISYLNMQNGNNHNVDDFVVFNNIGLHCIQVDDPEWATENWVSTAGQYIVFRESCAVLPTVHIPDSTFKAALVNNPGINYINDDEIQLQEAQSYSGIIDVAGAGISSLTGIEKFVNLKVLFCSYNQLTSLDLTHSFGLLNLDCSNNDLHQLNIRNGNNQDMESFEARGNPGLACIQVDYPGWASTFWGDYVDPDASFSADCEAVTGTAAPLEKASLSVYPNPTTGELTLALSATCREVDVEIRDVMGRVLVRKNYETTDQLDFTLDGPAGLYFVTVRAGKDEFVTVRVVKY